MAQDHNDIYSIVERLAILEGRITPTNVKHGLNTQQKSVPQMPALFKPKTQKILGGNLNAKNPMSGYAVGGCEESEEFDDDDAVNSKIDPFRDRTTIASEGVANEDVLDKVKKTLSDYLDTLKDELKTDSDLKDKKKEDSDLRAKDKKDRDLVAKENCEIDPPEFDSEVEEAAPVKTITNESGLWEVHGNEHTGFEIRHGNRQLPTRFRNLEEAELALEMFNLRRRRRDEAADYIDEA